MSLNGEKIGKWRLYVHLGGGGKGWCSKCLKNETDRSVSGHMVYFYSKCPPKKLEPIRIRDREPDQQKK